MSAVDPSRGAQPPAATEGDLEHFKPTGTVFLLVCFVAVLILLWVSVYIILLSRGVTV